MSHKHPPRLALMIFRWYCSDERVEELEGDLEEKFYLDIEKGKKHPEMRYWWNVIRCARSYAYKKQKKSYRSNNTNAMIKSILLSVIRNFKKSPLYATLNVVGIALSFTVFGLITIYLNYELSFEDFHSNADRIYRVTYKTESRDDVSHWARVPVDYVNLLPEEVPGIQTLIRFQNNEQKYVKIGSRKFKEDFVYQTDPDVFKVFSFDFIEGDPKTALADPKSIVLTESLAIKYFGKVQAVGEEIAMSGEWFPEPKSYQVTAVIKDVPSNTHLPINMLISFDSPDQRTWWGYTYIFLDEKTSANQLAGPIEEFIEKHSESEDAQEFFVLQPLKEIHLKSNIAREIIPNGNWQNINIFGIIALLIILIGFINFTNLNSAVYLSRFKEVGVRKVLGAADKQIAWAVLLESTFYSLIALFIGFLIIGVSFSYFRTFTGSEMTLDYLPIAALLFGVSLFVGLCAGIYPAKSTKSFKPISLLQKHAPSWKMRGSTSFSMKKIMLTVQFAVALLLICCALIASDQFSFMNKQNLALKPEQVLALPRVPNSVKDQYPVLKQKLSSIPGVKGVTACLEVPSREIRDAGNFVVSEMHSVRSEAPVMDIQVVGHEFFDLMNIDLVAGENFPDYIKPSIYPEFTEDYSYVDYLAEQPRAYLINQTAMEKLGITDPNEVIGKQARFQQLWIELKKGPIVGVVEDYHQASLKNAIDPTIYVYEPLWLNTILLRMETDEIVTSLEEVETAWNELFPNFKIEYQFLDDLYNQLYLKERKQLDLLSIFSIMALGIAFLGIFGLVAYVLKTKTKELAIRKVLGANIGSLVKMIGHEYVMLLVIGLVLAVPLCIFAMNEWLGNFAYRVQISPINFVVSLLAVVFLLLLTIGFQTIRASSTNPVESLRDE